MIKKLLNISMILCLLLSSKFGQAQQLAQYSQYLDNYYLVNSAATNLQNNVQVNFGFRHFWTDFAGSPKTIYLSAYAPLTKPDASQYMQSAMRLTDNLDTTSLKSTIASLSNHVVGLIVTQDDIGLFRKTTSHFTYSFHMPLTKDISISASPKLGWVHLSLNDDLRVLEDNDQPFQNFINNHQQQGMLDLGFGLWLYSDTFFFGYSLEQLTKSNAFEAEDIDGVEFQPHHFVMAGYRYRLSPYLNLVPNFMIRHTNGVPTSIDYSIRAEYGSKLWASLSYRRGNSLVMLLGMAISHQMSFSYSFDHSTNINQLNRVNAHEFSLRMNVLQNLHK